MTTPRTITLSYLHCLKCGHTWLPRSASRPSQCPLCHASAWDKERKSSAGDPIKTLTHARIYISQQYRRAVIDGDTARADGLKLADSIIAKLASSHSLPSEQSE